MKPFKCDICDYISYPYGKNNMEKHVAAVHVSNSKI
jgi:hypothetical protein